MVKCDHFGDIVFAVEEGIARGDACSACGAEWVNHELIHTDGCWYWAWMERA